jgi:glycosyltransferase involved in cell wall biosynthesis
MSTRADRHFIIAAYYFPPLGLAGTARPLAMANYFAELGYPVSVLTVKPIAYPIYDDSQLDTLHAGVKVYRAGSTDPARLAKLLPFFKHALKLRRGAKTKVGELIFPDSKVGFVKPALRLLTNLIRPNLHNILITTSPPVSIHQLGLNLTGQGALTWIADFRDVWGSLPLEDRSDDFRAKAESYLREITSAANLTTATSPLTLDYLQTNINAAADYHFLPNGYDESDFAAPVSEHNPSFGLYGTLNHLFGIEKLLAWMRQCNTKLPGQTISLRHVGHLDLPGLEKSLAEYNLKDSFTSFGYMPHHDSIKEIRSHAANIIMLSENYDTSYIIPSKLFELLRAEPPLIAILPQGNAARLLLEECDFSDVYIVDSSEQFDAAIRQLRSQSPQSPRAGVERFERRHELAGLLTRLEELL